MAKKGKFDIPLGAAANNHMKDTSKAPSSHLKVVCIPDHLFLTPEIK